MIRLRNPFRKIYVEIIDEMPNFRLYHGTNFLETYTYETRWICERLRFGQPKPFEERFLGVPKR